MKDIEFDLKIFDRKEKGTDSRKKVQKMKGLDLDGIDAVLDKFR